MTLAPKTKKQLVWLAWRGAVLILWGWTAIFLYPLTKEVYIPYYHISFEGAPDIKVLDRAHIIDNRRETDYPVPVEYEIVRPTYRLHILFAHGIHRMIDPMTFEATSLDGEPLNIQELKTEARCGKLFRTEAGSVMALSLANFLPDPTVGICSMPAHAFVYFQITDGDYNILGVEKLPYTVSKNGRYLEEGLRRYI